MTGLNQQPVVFLVDDDASIRTAMRRGLVAAGFAVRTFESADTFLAAHDPDMPGCLVTDVAMPGMSGPELHQQLILSKQTIAIIYITARADQTLRRQLLQLGAVECLFKPFSEQQLRVALDAALQSTRGH